jgi:hypothetical protein
MCPCGISEKYVPEPTTDTGEETVTMRKRRWNSIRSIYFTNFLNAVCEFCSIIFPIFTGFISSRIEFNQACLVFAAFSICLSTMWQYLESVGGSKAFLGIVVAAFRYDDFQGIASV